MSAEKSQPAYVACSATYGDRRCIKPHSKRAGRCGRYRSPQMASSGRCARCRRTMRWWTEQQIDAGEMP